MRMPLSWQCTSINLGAGLLKDRVFVLLPSSNLNNLSPKFKDAALLLTVTALTLETPFY